jgi:hypothetical protein
MSAREPASPAPSSSPATVSPTAGNAERLWELSMRS